MVHTTANTKPYPDGTKVRLIFSGRTARIVKQCPCTSPWIHYEVLVDGMDHVTSYDHKEITKLPSAAGPAQ